MKTQREIKFRIWDEDESIMVYDVGITPKSDGIIPYLIQENGNAEGEDRFIYFPNSILMQYTGLKDKNGKEIYEKDIITYGYQMSDETWRKGIFYLNDIFMKDFLEKDYYKNIEIIGNIYENKYLIQK